MFPLKNSCNSTLVSVLSNSSPLLQAPERTLQLLLSNCLHCIKSNVDPTSQDLSKCVPAIQHDTSKGSRGEHRNALHDVASNIQKVLKVAFIGRPNAGKSTLINQLIGRTVCPISMRAHTTRLKAKALLTEGDTQIVFLDTPGLVEKREAKKFKFEPSFLVSGDEAAYEADVIGVLYDAANKFQEIGNLDSTTMRMLLMFKSKKTFLIINKVDAVKKKNSLLEICRKLIGDTKSQKKSAIPSEPIDMLKATELTKTLHSWPYFDEVFMISALEGDGVGDVKEYLLQQAYPGSWPFKESTMKNKERIDLAMNFLRAAFLDEVPGEIPYQLSFKLSYFEESDEICAVEISVKPKHRRYITMLLKHIQVVARRTENNLSSAFEKPCLVRVNIENVAD